MKSNLLETVHLEPTGKCNLRCLYCYHSKYNSKEKHLKELSKEKWIDIINQCYELGCRNFSFSGGEFFVRKDYFDLLKHCSSLKDITRIAIFTNAELINTKIIKMLNTIKPKIEFRVSFDSIRNNYIVRAGSNNKTVINNIKKLKNNGNLVIINTMLTSFNIEELLSLYDCSIRLKIDKWIIDLPFSYGRFIKNSNKLAVSYEIIVNKVVLLLKIYLKEKKKPFALEINNLFKSHMLENGYYCFNRTDNPCDYTKRGITIRPDGTVSICPSLDLEFGTLKKQSVLEILRSKKRKQFYNIQISDIEKCSRCRYLKICGGGCRADALYLEGNILNNDPASCACMPLFEKEILPIFPENLKELIRNNLE